MSTQLQCRHVQSGVMVKTPVDKDCTPNKLNETFLARVPYRAACAVIDSSIACIKPIVRWWIWCGGSWVHDRNGNTTLSKVRHSLPTKPLSAAL